MDKNKVRIVGIDPGFDRLGFAIIDKEKNIETLVFSTCIETKRKETIDERIFHIGSELKHFFEIYKPEELAIETIFFTKNQKTVVAVAEVRGVCLYIAKLFNMSIFEYSPPQIKMAITGYGKATKEDISVMVPKIMKKISINSMIDDEIDAIAIALTHSANRKNSLISKGFF